MGLALASRSDQVAADCALPFPYHMAWVVVAEVLAAPTAGVEVDFFDWCHQQLAVQHKMALPKTPEK